MQVIGGFGLKGFAITVKNGLLDPKHIKAMQVNSKTTAVWCYLWFLDKMTKIVDDGKGGQLGVVLGGRPIKLQEIADDLGLDIKTIRKMYHQLKENGYITNSRTPYGNIVSVTKAHKIFGTKTTPDLPQRGKSETTPDVVGQIQNTVGLSDVEYSQYGRSDDHNTVGLIRQYSNNTKELNTDVLSNSDLEIEKVIDHFEKKFGKMGRAKFQPAAASTLLERHGFNRVCAGINAAMQCRGEPYAPSIANIEDLRDKWIALETYFIKSKRKSDKKRIFEV